MLFPEYIGISSDSTSLYISDSHLEDTICVSMSEIFYLLSEMLRDEDTK